MRDIDRQIAELMGHRVQLSDSYDPYYFEPKYEQTIPLPHYSSDWNAMRLLVEWLQGKGIDIEMNIESNDLVKVALYYGEYGEVHREESAPLALCKAVLDLPPGVLA